MQVLLVNSNAPNSSLSKLSDLETMFTCRYEKAARYNWAVFTICSFNVPFLNEAITSTLIV